MLAVGLTGGIGAGKTTVAGCFLKYHAEIIDTDELAKELVMPNTPALAEITERFGSSVLTQDGSLDRKQLRNIIFQDLSQRRWLEELLHPRIWQSVQNTLQSSDASYHLIIVPLLIESGLYKQVDRVLVVDCSEQLQLERAASRDEVSSENIKAIMQSQLSREERISYADDIIYNDGDLLQLDSQVKRLHQQYLAKSK